MENTIKLTRIRLESCEKRRTRYFRIVPNWTASTPLEPLPFLTSAPLTLSPEIPRPDKAVAAHGILLTATRAGDMAADVVDPQHGWHILINVFQGQELHFLYISIASRDLSVVLPGSADGRARPAVGYPPG